MDKGIIGEALATIENHLDLMTQEQLWKLTVDLAGLLYQARVRAAALRGIEQGSELAAKFLAELQRQEKQQL